MNLNTYKSKIDFDIKRKDENTIVIGKIEINTKQRYGIEASEFVASYEDLGKIGLRMNFSTYYIEQLKGYAHVENLYCSFIYYCSILKKTGVNTTNLISQFNAAERGQDFREINHASSIAKLAFIYHRGGYKVRIATIDNGPDLYIDDISVELKTSESQILKDVTKEKPPKLKKVAGKSQVDITNEIVMDISKALRNHLPHAVKQGNMIFFDFTNAKFFGIAHIPLQTLSKIVEPKQYRLVFYSTHQYMPGLDITHSFNGTEKALGKIVAPDLDKFIGYYIDIDPYLWNFLSKN